MRRLLLLLAGPALLLGACASVAGPPPNDCHNIPRERLDDILSNADWAAEGRVYTSWETRTTGGAIVGDASGKASIRLGRTLKGHPPRAWAFADWAVMWSDTEPFQVGEQPQAHEPVIVWGKGRAAPDLVPIACLTGAAAAR